MRWPLIASVLTSTATLFLVATSARSFADETLPSFLLHGDDQNLPRSGPRALCRKPYIVVNIIKAFGTIDALQKANVEVEDFNNTSTIDVDVSAKAFSCHGTFLLSSGQVLPGSFFVRNIDGRLEWAWKNDASLGSTEPKLPSSSVNDLQERETTGSVARSGPAKMTPDDVSVSVRGVGTSNQFDGSNSLNDVTVTSRVESLTIADVVVNRGSCRGSPQGGRFPIILGFGESLRYRVFPCYPLEVTIKTTRNAQTYDFGVTPKEGDVLGIEKFDAGGQIFKKLRITSYEKIAISEIVINRGNCPPNGDVKYDPPKILAFGDTLDVGPFACDAIEAEVLSDKEPVTINW